MKMSTLLDYTVVQASERTYNIVITRKQSRAVWYKAYRVFEKNKQNLVATVIVTIWRSAN